jgi:hypothetical protein
MSQDTVPELPPSIKVRDFAYESAYICERGESSRSSPCSTSSVGDEGSTRTSGCMKRKRRHEQGHESEGLPAGKRARLDQRPIVALESEKRKTGIWL